MTARRYPKSPDFVSVAAQIACLLEASAEKPGNVTPSHAFRDADFTDFLKAAAAIGPEIARAGIRSVGATILAAVQATRVWTRANVNLGIILLFAPIARAALVPETPSGKDTLRDRLHDVLTLLTVDDARAAYAAIRLASPGGLGQVDQHDVRSEPHITLRDAMAIAARRDRIAAEYISDYRVTFEYGIPAFRHSLRRGLVLRDAVVQVFLELLATFPDTLIARKQGTQAADRVQTWAAEALNAGGMYTPRGRRAIAQLDSRLRDPANTLNPGTTADLVAATLFVAILEGVI